MGQIWGYGADIGSMGLLWGCGVIMGSVGWLWGRYGVDMGSMGWLWGRYGVMGWFCGLWGDAGRLGVCGVSVGLPYGVLNCAPRSCGAEALPEVPLWGCCPTHSAAVCSAASCSASMCPYGASRPHTALYGPIEPHKALCGPIWPHMAP